MGFSPFWPAVVFTLFAWWFSTGAILWLVRRPRASFGWSVGVGGAAAVAAAGVIIATRNDASVTGAFTAFAAALVIWGWHELSFLTGHVMGPRKTPCPPGARGWTRFRLATATLIHHEIALAATAAALITLAWGTANPVAAWTFGLLFALRLSAKLNLFAGVPNLSQEFFPPQLEHLKGYMPRRPAGVLFALSISGQALGAAAFLRMALTGPTPFETAAWALLFTLTLLGLLEHLFMVAPVPDTALWRWALATPAPKPGRKP